MPRGIPNSTFVTPKLTKDEANMIYTLLEDFCKNAQTGDWKELRLLGEAIGTMGKLREAYEKVEAKASVTTAKAAKETSAA